MKQSGVRIEAAVAAFKEWDNMRMDVLMLLREVSDAYRNLKSLAVEAVILTESGDENASQRSEQRVRFFYAAPNRIRYESCSRNGIVQVADGQRLYTSFHSRHQFGDGPRYRSVPAAEMHGLPHLFRPDFPFGAGGEVFLYQGIEERVAQAQILRDEDGCHVISVIYEIPPHTGLVVRGSAVWFWVNVENHMVMRQQVELGHRFPGEDEVTWSRHSVAVRKMRVDEPLPEETFTFTPPPGASLETARRCSGVGHGSSFVQRGPDGQLRLEHRVTHTWEGDTLVEHSKWKIRGMTLAFERRLKFSGDAKELHVGERISGPKGEVESSCKLPVG